MPRWIGWLGIFVGHGWVARVAEPRAERPRGRHVPGFVAFFVFMASMGVALVRWGGETASTA